MPNALKSYRIDRPGRFVLKDFDPAAKPLSVGDKAADKERVAEIAQQLGRLQDNLYALRKDKLLLVLQGMDTSGKDGTIRAVFQAIEGQRRRDVSRIYLTASGGPFRGRTLREMRDVTVRQALGHPTWRMGAKITIDSATLMNKGLEVIEATWLFGIPPSRIEVLIHPQSIVHSMVEFRDGSLLAQLGVPDMRIPIGYALSYPERLPLELPRLSPHRMHGWSFEAPDRKNFPALGLAYEAIEAGGTAPAVLNAANETAVHSFLAGRIRFTDIPRIVERILGTVSNRAGSPTLQDILEADRAAREEAARQISRMRRPSSP
ncbi:MAG: hypothetical protein OHK0044_23660 [Burkholderiaceae bacterium]